MLLSTFSLFLSMLAVLTTAPFLMHAYSLSLRSHRKDWHVTPIAIVIGITLAVAIAFRNPNFGVDTRTYLGIFSAYCAGGSLTNMEVGFLYSAQVINGLMLGLCDTHFLSLSWVIFITLALFAARARAGEKIIYISLLLASMVGIELTTNALRQGFSIALLIPAISYYRRNNPVAVLLSACAILLHSSSGLVLLIYFLCTLGPRVFLVVVGTMSLGIVITLQTGSLLSLLPELLRTSRFIYEIQKYLAHDADELIIRILSFASLLGILLAPLLFSVPARQALRRSRGFGIAVKMALATLPFLYLPYFGYRIVYGVYPVALWLIITELGKANALNPGSFLAILSSNLFVLFTWSAGSSYMRSIPFLS